MTNTRTADGGQHTPTIRRIATKLLFATPLWIALQSPAYAEPIAVRAVNVQSATGGRSDAQSTRKIVIRTSKTPTFTTFKLADPARVLVDVSGAELAGVPEQQTIADGVVRELKVHTFQDQASSMTRVEIVLERDAEHVARVEGDTIVVELRAAESKAELTPGATLGKLEKRVSKKGVTLSAKLTGPAPKAEDVAIQQLADPPRIVVDVANVAVQPKWQKLDVKAQGIERARVGTQDGGVRFVLDLNGDATLPEVTVDVVKGRLELAVTPPPAPALAAVAPRAELTPEPVVERAPVAQAPVAQAPVAPAPVEAPKAEVAKAEVVEAPKPVFEAPKPAPVVEAPKAEPAKLAKAEPAKSKAAAVKVEDVKFEPKNGFYRLSMTLSGEFTAVTDGSSTKQLPTMRIPAAALPEAFVRTLDTTGVAGHIVQAVSTYREGDDVLVAAQLGSTTEHRQWTKGNVWYWDFRAKDGSMAETAATSDGGQAPTRQVAGYQSPAAKVGQLTLGQRAPRYTGRRISLDLKDADVQNVLRLLADVSQLNIVAGENVKGKVTLKLKNVPWDQALDVVLQARSLDKVRSGNIIRVAPASELEAEAKLRAQREEANQKLEPLSVRIVPVNYALADKLKDQVVALLSPRGKVNVDPRTNVLIIEDISDVLVKVERLIRTLDTQTPQVMIEARVVQARTNLTRSLGIQWGGQLVAAPEFGNATGLSFPNRIGVQGTASQQTTGVENLQNFLFTPGTRGTPMAVNLPAGATTGIAFSLGSANSASLLTLRLSAEEQKGRAKIVASPRVVTMDNQTAKITSGERIPFTVVTANGPTTRFVEATLTLEVIPHITGDGAVLMRIKAQQNEVSDRRDNFGTPGLFVREAETEMVVSDGDTAVLGGIYRRGQRESISQVPFLGDIPVLGWLFKSRTEADERDELLIFVTPRILNRSEAGVTGG